MDIPNLNLLFFKKKASFFLKWLVISTLISILIGSISAFFLFFLDYVTKLREENNYLLFFLPMAGLAIGLLYYVWGGSANEGNNLLIKEYHSPEKKIPLKMVPFVLIGTLTTHFFGGSAGREGTAVQMGGAIADQFTSFFKLTVSERQTLLLMGISGGFSSVFGTPIAGTLFAIEIMFVGKYTYNNIPIIALTALLSNYICLLWGTIHTEYPIIEFVPFSILVLLKVIILSTCFGITAIIFIKTIKYFQKQFSKYIRAVYLHPLVGGLLIILLYYSFNGDKYLGLGIPTIYDSFLTSQEYSVFLLKILFTAITLSAGFKGGEVTPLFFIGAALGSYLAFYLDIPISFAAALGFVAVFSGATKTPLACIFMGIELFSGNLLIYLIISCFISFYVSKNYSIYKFQKFS